MEASIPVDLLNPGQVFACLGFLEAADVLLGDAEGGFDWSDEAHVRFLLGAAGEANPFAVVLKFLAEAEVCPYAPVGYREPQPKSKGRMEDDEEQDTIALQPVIRSEAFPMREGDPMALPIRLESRGRLHAALGHWADGSLRNKFKLYAGNRSAQGIAHAMLRGTSKRSSKRPSKSLSVDNVKTRGIAALWAQQHQDMTGNPFELLTLMGGSFNFDPRGAWTALDAGYSPNKHKHGVSASPVVELLAAWGLEHARPDEYETRQVRYGAWRGLVPPILARPALAGVSVAIPVRRFRFVLDLSGKNKVVTFAQEETNA